jgi:HD-GYP domain-containing protein (c-di-GMP phosphodiesterase class II)
VLSHQERFDGGGYPRKLRGESIHIGARIFAVADTLDAMTSDRPYRMGTGFDVAMEEINRCAGTQFDPEVVRAFLDIGEKGLLDIRQNMDAHRKARMSTPDELPEVGTDPEMMIQHAEAAYAVAENQLDAVLAETLKSRE